MPRAPAATYRLQLSAHFGFADAAAIVPYLARLGISAVYSSPGFRARPGSTHGYDVVDPSHLSPDLGGEHEFRAFLRARMEHDLGLLLDIVPNHMAATWDNAWWRDVLENGPSSPYATYFDIDWAAIARDESERLLIPVLGAPYSQVLAEGQLAITCEEGLVLRYFEHKYPLDPLSYPLVFEAIAARRPELAERLLPLATFASHIPSRYSRDVDSRAVRRLQAAVLKHRTVSFFIEHRRSAEDALAAACAEKKVVASLVHRVLAGQCYRLCHWRLAKERLNYRRFFDISDLVALSIERAEVFAARHEVEFELVRRGIVTGLRIDHIDGLADPERYLEMLDRGAKNVRGEPLYVVVEKILAPGERIPQTWRCAGTTGYDFLNVLSRVFVDAAGLEAMRRIYGEVTGDQRPFLEAYYACQRLVIEELFSSELSRLARALAHLAAQDLEGCDLSFRELYRALLEVTACLPVYRTYTRDAHARDEDRALVTEAIRTARRFVKKHEVSAAAFLFLGRVLRLETTEDAEREPWLRFVKRWQQWTGAVMAKGLEDTAFYQYPCLLALNEVGGDGAGRAGVDGLAELHAHNERMAREHPLTMTTTTTHDTKRSEDARARLCVLSEIPLAWQRHLRRWLTLNASRHVSTDGARYPDRRAEVMLYQTMLGSWPLSEAEVPELHLRLRGYMTKAMREAKLYTSWTDPDEAYEAAVLGFVDGLFAARSSDAAFWKDFRVLQQRVAAAGAVSSLAQVVLKIGSPGVCDVYQGCELWDFSMVDPDNRRPVAFALRTRLLSEVEHVHGEAAVRALCERWKDGAIKLLVTHRGLLLRKRDPELFLRGEYLPVYAAGPRAQNVCAFLRRLEDRWLLCVAPRLVIQLDRSASPARSLAHAFDGTSLVLPEGAPRVWKSALTGAAHTSLALSALLAAAPCGYFTPAG